MIIVDNVMPCSAWRRPLAHAIWRLDRGRFVRSEETLSAILQKAIPIFDELTQVYLHLVRFRIDYMCCADSRQGEGRGIQIMA